MNMYMFQCTSIGRIHEINKRILQAQTQQQKNKQNMQAQTQYKAKNQ